jgi:CBS domain containing-hemolysin-like protein
VRVTSRLPVEDLGSLFEMDLENHDVETVGGLLAQRLGRVPLPGSEAEIAGLRLRAEGGKDRRGRMRISTVVVRRSAERAPSNGDGAGTAAERRANGNRGNNDREKRERSGERGRG